MEGRVQGGRGGPRCEGGGGVNVQVGARDRRHLANSHSDLATVHIANPSPFEGVKTRRKNVLENPSKNLSLVLHCETVDSDPCWTQNVHGFRLKHQFAK